MEVEEGGIQGKRKRVCNRRKGGPVEEDNEKMVNVVGVDDIF